MAYKQWISDERRAQQAERKWLDTYRPQERRVSGKYYFPIPREVYAPAGGVDKLAGQLLR